MKRLIFAICACPLLAMLLAASGGSQYAIPFHTGASNSSFSCGSLPFSDSFSGSGGLSSCWSVPSGDTACAQASGKAVSSSSSNTCITTVTGVTYPVPTQYVQAAVTYSSTSQYTGLCPSMKISGYGLCVFPGLKSLLYITPTGGGGITSWGYLAASGDVIKISLTSSTIGAYDVTTSTWLLQSYPYSNTTYNSGPPGMWVAGATGNSITAFTAD